MLYADLATYELALVFNVVLHVAHNLGVHSLKYLHTEIRGQEGLLV